MASNSTNTKSVVIKSELIEALLFAKFDRAKELLEQGADVNETEELKSGSVWSALTVVVKKPRHNETEGIILLLLQKGANVNWANEKGQTALVLASHSDNLEAVKLLVEHGADVNHIVQRDGNTPLIIAAKRNNTKIVEILLASGADVSYVNKDKLSALMVAAKYGSESVVELLLNHSTVNINLVDFQGWSALWYASYKGHCSIIKMLLTYGADIRLVNDFKQNVVMLASWMGQFSAGELLLDKGADVNHTDVDGNSALMLASFNNNLMEVKTLLQHGADVNLVNETGWTPLLLASQGGYNSIVSLLLERGANIHHVNHDEKDALAIALQNANIETVKLLLTHNADVNRKYSFGWTSLMITSTQQHTGTIGCIDLLIKHGVDVNEISEDGWDALGIASFQGHSQIVEHLLLCKACDKNIDSRKATALMLAANLDHTCIIDILVNKGQVNVNQTNQDGVTALMVASEKGNLESVKALLKYGANVNIKDSKGRCALKFAFQNNHHRVIKMLAPNVAGMRGLQNYTDKEMVGLNQETPNIAGMRGLQNYTDKEMVGLNQETLNSSSQIACLDVNTVLQEKSEPLKLELGFLEKIKAKNINLNLNVFVHNNNATNNKFIIHSIETLQTPSVNTELNAFKIDTVTFGNPQSDKSNALQFNQVNAKKVTNLATDNSTIKTN